MNSSGIKRGLAATAISAMAVTGLPLLASSASADTGESATVAYVGPTRNAGDQGGLVVLKTKNLDAGDLSRLKLSASDLSGDNPDTPNQNVDLVQSSLNFTPDGATNEFGGADGFDEISFRVTATTPNAGDAVKYAAYFDDLVDANADGDNDPTTGAAPVGNDEVDADEARAQIETKTSGAVRTVEITPSTQTAPAGQASGPYTVAITDAAGRATQLTGTETVEITATGTGLTFSDSSLDKADLERGSDEIKATGTDTGLQAFKATATGTDISGSDTATLDVVNAANLTNDDVDVVTGADSWDGYGDTGTPDDPISVRVDQGTIRLDIASSDKVDQNATVVLTVNGGNDVTFGGKKTMTVSTTLDANGRGSIVLTPDAGTIQENDTFSVSGSGAVNLNFKYERAHVGTVDAPADVYISAVKGSVDVTAQVKDQFGLPVAGAEVDARIVSGPNTSATPQPRKTTDANGEATFTFTDKEAVAGQSSKVEFRVFNDQFDNTVRAIDDSTTIRYTQDGQGADYTLSLDGVNTAGTAYDPSKVSVAPLTDTDATDAGTPKGDEVANLDIVGGETGAPVTVNVDNGALILKNGDDQLSEGTSTAKGVLGTDTFSLVGTKSGVVTVTVTSAGRTETAQFTVEAQDQTSAARNVSVSGPAEAEAGDLVTYNAVVTDAFGNPVAGVDFYELNVQVSGPAALQDNGAVTDENGVLPLNVRFDDDAQGSVTVRVEGVANRGNFNQFGAKADEEYPGDGAGTAKGLPASMNVATATTTVKVPVVKKTNPALVVKGRGHKGGDDKVIANAIRRAAGATAELYKKTKHGKKLIGTATLNDKGNAHWKVADKNGKKKTTYKVHVSATDLTKKGHGGDRLR